MKLDLPELIQRFTKRYGGKVFIPLYKVTSSEFKSV
jgi:hypothetical protein